MTILHDNFQTQVGTLLQLVRRISGRTQEQFAELTGMNLRHLQKIEAGLVNTKLETLAKALDVIDMSFSTFFSIIEDSDLQKKLVCKKIDRDSLQSLNTMIRMIALKNKEIRELNISKEIFEFDSYLREHKLSDLESIPHNVVEFDENLECTWGNKEAHNFFGEDLVGSLGSRYFADPHEDTQCRFEFLNVAKRYKFLFAREIRYLGQNDIEKVIAVMGHPVLKNEKISRILSMGIDITAHRRIQSDLNKSIKKSSRT